jgi:RecA-family ATPase
MNEAAPFIAETFSSRAPSPVQTSANEPAAAAPRIIRLSEFNSRPVKPREWIVPDWIPCGVVTGLYGDGGFGKTLLAQQLQTGTAIGGSWIGLPVQSCASLGVYCEDSEDELHRRQVDINASYCTRFDDLRDAHWMPRLSEGNMLMTFGKSGVGELTMFHRYVKEAALDLRTRLVIVDTASDTFGGNEIDRKQVRQFVSRALGSIALAIDGAVLLCAHPSRSGLSSGEGDSGSTGWNNALRSRLFLRAPDVETGEALDPNARILQRRKSNYGPRLAEIKLRWTDGAIAPEQVTRGVGGSMARRDVKAVFLTLLDEFTAANRNVSDNSRSGNYAPRLFGKVKNEQREDYREADFRTAMEALFHEQRIENLTYGKAADPRQKIVRTGAK